MTINYIQEIPDCINRVMVSSTALNIVDIQQKPWRKSLHIQQDEMLFLSSYIIGLSNPILN